MSTHCLGQRGEFNIITTGEGVFMTNYFEVMLSFEFKVLFFSFGLINLFLPKPKTAILNPQRE